MLIATSKMLKDAKNELFDGIHGRVLEVGAGIGVNVHFFNRPEVEHWVASERADCKPINSAIDKSWV